jgi:hypothetical protein
MSQQYIQYITQYSKNHWYETAKAHMRFNYHLMLLKFIHEDVSLECLEKSFNGLYI